MGPTGGRLTWTAMVGLVVMMVVSRRIGGSHHEGAWKLWKKTSTDDYWDRRGKIAIFGVFADKKSTIGRFALMGAIRSHVFPAGRGWDDVRQAKATVGSWEDALLQSVFSH